MRVLGLDPGLTCAGYGVVDATRRGPGLVTYGVVRTGAGDVAPRLATLYETCRALIAEHRPDVVTVERVLFNSNAKTAMSVAQAAGIALLAAYQSACEIAEYTPSEMKLAVTGYGAADKKQVQAMVGRLLGMDVIPRPADAADALGLALTHIQVRRLRSLERTHA